MTVPLSKFAIAQTFSAAIVPSCDVGSETLIASLSASLIASFATKGTASSRASEPANVVLPEPGMPFTTIKKSITVQRVDAAHPTAAHSFEHQMQLATLESR